MANVYIGTSGYYYPGWIGEFYPEGLKSSEFLTYYQNFFNTVEINSTFYHMPKPSTIKNLKSKLHSDFLVSVKLNRTITHLKRLKDVSHELEKFFESVSLLAFNLGVILIQLPPSLKIDIDLLNSFLSKLPTSFRYAIEFRHKSWLNESTYALLSKFNAAFVITHGDNYPFEKRVTADFVYMRLHGPKELYASSYSENELLDFSTYIKTLKNDGKDVFVYFNNDFYGYAIKNATTLKNFLT